MRVGGLLCLALAGLFAGARAEAPAPPPFYAIVDVRVLTGDGRTLESATVLIADGLIEGVGRGLPIPSDALEIDGSDLVLYPGFVDALSDLGQPRDEADEDDEAPTIRGPEDRPQTTPWKNAAEMLGEDQRLAKWREAGFTAAVTAPVDGFFAGQAALIHLGRGEAHERVIATPIAQRMNFRGAGRSRGYPGSLMGVLGYVKQVFEDARHAGEVQAIYAADPAGYERPTFDRTLDPIREAWQARQPFLMPGDLAREIDRVLVLRRDYDIHAVIYGAEGGYERAAAIAASGAPVLVGLDWPKANKDRDPERDPSFRTLYHRRLAPTTPAALAEAGVPFAFISDGLSGPKPFLDNVKTAIDAGLDEGAALRALTLAPAEIFGVADRVGTIETGKIANLVLATALPWQDEAEVRDVFIDGRRYANDVEEEEERKPPAQDVSGTWTLTMETPRGTSEATAELSMDPEGKVTGEITGEQGTTPIESGRMSDTTLTLESSRTMGSRTIEMKTTLEIDGETATGSASMGRFSVDVSGERTSKAEPERADEAESEEDEVPLDELHAVKRIVQGPVRAPGTFAITGATIYTVSGETIEGGTVVVRDGKIAAVGRDVRIPSGAERFDAAGGSVIPGIIDAHSHIAVNGGVNEGSLAVTSMVKIGDVLNPDDISIYRALAGGVTAANILHGSANPIGGQNAVVKLRWGSDAEGLLIEDAPAGIKFALGENPKRSNGRRTGPRRYPASRMGVMDVIREAFIEARQYQNEWDAYRAAKRGAKPLPPRRDFRLEALAEILRGERLVHSHCYRADEILQLLRLAEEFGFRIATLQHVLEGYKVADEIAAHGAGGSTFSDWWGYKVEAYDAIPHNAALMAERGVLVSINSDSAEEMRHLNQEAAKAVKWGGMDELAALAMVTLNPAIQLGIDGRVGSIEVGKDADLVVYDGPPLAMSSVVQQTFVDGVLYFDIDADRERQASLEAIKKRLLGKDETDGEDEESGDDEIVWQEEIYSCREVH